MTKKLIILLCIALIFRLVLAFQFYSGDVNNHISWAKDILQSGPQGIYEREFYFKFRTLTPNYPPLTLFLFTVAYGLYEGLYSTAWWLNTNVAVFPSNIIYFFQGLTTIPAFLKLPAIFADLGIAYFIYLFAKKLSTGKKWPLVASSLVLFNPAFFFNSSSWGQVEAIPIFFVLASFYYLLYRKQFIVSGLLFTLAILSKQNAVVFAPIFLLIFWNKYGLKETIKSAVVSLALFWLMFLPFNNGNILTFPFETYWNKILTNSVSDYVTYHAFNFWTLVVGQEKIHDSALWFFGLSYQTWGYGLFIIFSFIILSNLNKVKLSEYATVFSCALVSFASFLFLTRLHERHLEPTLPFLLLVSIKNRRFIPIFIFVSIFHLANLYHNWWAPRIDSAVILLSEPSVIYGGVLILLGSFFYLFTSFLRLRKNV